jgi:hypothetical protein
MIKKSYASLLLPVLLALIIFSWSSCKDEIGKSKAFYAYYTHLKSNEPFEKYSRTSEYADIIVNIRKNEKLVFWRGTSYLPYWETPKGKWSLEEIVPRKGDGSKTMPDANNMFSTIKLIENSACKIVVLWRYLPVFEMNRYPHFPIKADPRTFVEELFIITSEGHVTREIKKGTPKFDDWENPGNKTVQTLILNRSGISCVKTEIINEPVKTEKLTGNKIISDMVEKPVLNFSFDEGVGDETRESITNSACFISGHKSLWKKGVSGTALEFDGYTSSVVLPSTKAPEISLGLTIEAWVALAAYPWNWVPVFQQGDSTGYALGLNDHGNPTFQLGLGNKLYILTSKTHLDRYTWYHLAGTFDRISGKISLYVNGKLNERIFILGKYPDIPDCDIRIGQSLIKRAAPNLARPKVTYPTTFSYDGLIDEIQVYDKCLDEKQIIALYHTLDPGESLSKAPDMEVRHLPVPIASGKFRGYYTNLKYTEVWDNMWRFGNHPDIIVEFDKTPSKFVFWKGTDYVPVIANDKNQWYSNEFNETWGTAGGFGCQEPMSDKNLLTTSVKILEQSDARVVVNWRCALMDTKMNTQANFDTVSGWGDWIDWDYYIYPDGVAVKHMRLWTSGKLNHEWQEGMVVIGENEHPEDVIEQKPSFYYVDDNGKSIAYNWEDAYVKKIDYTDKRIFVANLKSDWDPFTIQDFTGGDVYNSKEITSYSVFCSWNHWPVSLIKSDCHTTIYPDRVTHTSLNHVKWFEYSNCTSESAPYYEKILMEGMSNKSPEELYPLSCSWLSPAAIEIEHGAENASYDSSQRAYLVMANDKKLRLKIQASPETPVVNLCFVVKNWATARHAAVKINGNKVGADQLRQGVIRDTEGKKALVVWIGLESTDPFGVEVNDEKL